MRFILVLIMEWCVLLNLQTEITSTVETHLPEGNALTYTKNNLSFVDATGVRVLNRIIIMDGSEDTSLLYIL